MVRVYYSINWTTRTTSGTYRRYNRILEGEDMSDHKAQDFARNKANNSRNMCVDCWRMDNEIIEPEYKDANGVWHASKDRTIATRLTF